MSKVLCVQKSVLETALSCGPWISSPTEPLGRRLSRVEPTAVMQLLSTLTLEFVERAEAEVDESRLQIIPYIAITNEKGDTALLAYQRKSAGEYRLEGKWSVGFGGHIEETDDLAGEMNFMNIFAFAMARELAEELDLSGRTTLDFPRFEPVQLIYTGDMPEAGPVDRVHLGVCVAAWFQHTWDLKPMRENGVLPPYKHCNAQMLDEMYDQFETWSKLLTPKYDAAEAVA